VLIDGVLGGLWHHRRSGRRVAITAELFRPLTTGPRGQLESHAERIADFLRAEPARSSGRCDHGLTSKTRGRPPEARSAFCGAE
jgi:hypothetical protein